ncbi:MAG TPA: ParA family protein [Candidatus Binatia bacterium]|nr:ParA family protein [Candidatus Binatia bacterium]
MRRVVVAMFKGGTGKSTVATTVAVGLARRGRRVTLVDLDAQANATDMLGYAEQRQVDMYGVIVEGTAPEAIAIKIDDYLQLLPSSQALAPISNWLVMQNRREEILKKRLAKLHGAEYVILDTGPSFSLLNLNALMYATEAWLPVSMDYLSLTGVSQLLDTLKMVEEELGHRLPLRYVIPTFFDGRTRKSTAVLDTLKESFGATVTPPIRTNVKLSEAASYHKSIFDYAPESAGAEDFRTLVDHIDKES